MAPTPMIRSPRAADGAGQTVKGTTLVIGDWPAEGMQREVAPPHVHHADDEAWHVVSGALRFRFGKRELIARAGSTVLVPAGVPHTFGNAGPEPSRFIIILSTRLDELINQLYASDPAEHPDIYRGINPSFWNDHQLTHPPAAADLDDLGAAAGPNGNTVRRAESAIRPRPRLKGFHTV